MDNVHKSRRFTRPIVDKSVDSRVFGTKTVDNPVDIVESLGDSGCMVYAYMAMEIKYLFPSAGIRYCALRNGAFSGILYRIRETIAAC